MERRQRKSVSDKNIGGDFDYAPSDVYLFVKVLWMAEKNDINGFRGEYKRGMSQI